MLPNPHGCRDPGNSGTTHPQLESDVLETGCRDPENSGTTHPTHPPQIDFHSLCRWMRVAVITPDRSDRPAFLDQCKKYVRHQTIEVPHFIVDDPAIDPTKPDIGRRIRLGLERAREAGCDVAAVFENDDFYSPRYLELQLHDWSNAGSPLIWGIQQTIYYHVGIRKWRRLDHPHRSSLCAMLIRTDILDKFRWSDTSVYLDLWLWHNVHGNKKARNLSGGPAERRFIGIKHGTGLCGGAGHRTTYKYTHSDPDGRWLRSIVGEDNYTFYQSMFDPNLNRKGHPAI